MAQTFTVTTTDIEDKALRWAVVDPAVWLEIVVKHRAACAMEEIYNVELKKAIEDPNVQSISSNRESVVMSSTEQTAKQRRDQFQAIVNNNSLSDEERIAQIGALTPRVVPDIVRGTGRRN